MPQSHLCSVKMEEIHQLHSLALSQGGEINSFGFVVQLEFDWIYFDVFFQSA